MSKVWGPKCIHGHEAVPREGKVQPPREQERVLQYMPDIDHDAPVEFDGNPPLNENKIAPVGVPIYTAMTPPSEKPYVQPPPEGWPALQSSEKEKE